MSSFGLGTAGRATWEEIKHYEGPYPAKSGDEGKASVGRWFNYFWREALRAPSVTNSDGNDRQAVLKVFNEVFDFNRQTKTPVVKTSFDLMARNQPDRVRALFMTIIGIGFRGYDVASLQDATPTFVEMIKVNNDVIRLGFRCDSRDWPSVSATGAKRKVEVDTIRQDWGLDKAWHPFSQPDVRNKLWFRNGVNDNCLHATLSVGSGFVPVTRFPRIDEVEFYGNLPNKALRFWTKAERETFFQRGKIKFVNFQHDGIVETMLWTGTYVYIFKVNGLVGINTEEIQGAGDAFPERGLVEVSADRHLAVCTIRRIHYGYPSVEDTVAYKATDWMLTPDEGSVKLKLGDSDPLLQALKQKLTFLGRKLPARPDGYAPELAFPRDFSDGSLDWNVLPQNCVFPASAPKAVVSPAANLVTSGRGASENVK